MAKFTKIAGVDVYVEEAEPLIEDGLKCTVARKACLLLLEYVASIIVRESKAHFSVQCELVLVRTYRMGGKFRAIPDFALFRKFRGY